MNSATGARGCGPSREVGQISLSARRARGGRCFDVDKPRSVASRAQPNPMRQKQIVTPARIAAREQRKERRRKRDALAASMFAPMLASLCKFEPRS